MNQNNNQDKESLDMRFHQEYITDRTIDLIKNNKNILWGCKCRSGKTYMVGGLISKYQEIKQKINILIVTPAPTETIMQFTTDLFHKYKDFDNFIINTITNSKQIKDIKKGNSNIFVISKQLLQRYIKNTISKIKDIDIIFFDETHFSGTTDLSLEIFKSYSTDKTIKIFLTATYNKPLHRWNIPENCQIYWDVEDEQLCKKLDIKKLSDKYGVFINRTINRFIKGGYTIPEIFESYKIMPNLYILTTCFDQDRYTKIKELIKDTSYGFSFQALFDLKDKEFVNAAEVSILLDYITGSNKEVDFKDQDMSIFNRINNICESSRSRKPFTQLWFLPCSNINDISIALEKLMKNNKILKNYDTMIVNSCQDIKDIKKLVTKREETARATNKLGLILLVGNMLSLGITLSNCDVVFLLNNTVSSDKIMQQMYRCMTEGDNKQMGFVVDLNINRVLNTCLTYNTCDKNMSIEDKFKYLINTNLINIDADLFKSKQIDSMTLVTKLMDIWKGDPVNNLQLLLKNLENDHIVLDNDTQQLLNKSFNKSTNKKNSVKINDQPIGKGIEKTIDEEQAEKLKEETVKQENQDDNISFTRDVLPYIIPLVCILTVKDKNYNIIEILNTIKNNKNLLEVFNDQTNIWWNKTDLFDMIQNIITKHVTQNSSAFNISINFKMSMQSLIDKPVELLELINNCLKPKDIEKKKFGEVFTPMKLVNEMLDKLPGDVWTNKDLKWLDPCCGMGNFSIAVYLRLMNSLEPVITDQNMRKKHILENMLYMCELNKKNCLITQQIFDLNNNYKLNLHEGDFLEYKPDIKFDIVMGNPPYQDGSGNKGKGHTLWTKFVDVSINLLKENGYLVFIHPSVWRQIEHPSLNTIKNKQLIYLEIHNVTDGMTTFKCATRYDWYVLQNIPCYKDTIIKSEDGIVSNIDLRQWTFIPNKMFNEISLLITNNDKLDVWRYRSTYSTENKKLVSKEKNNIFKYPLIYTINKKNEITFRYTNDNTKDHFGKSKFIFSNGAGFYCDKNGDYGLTEWAYCIYDDATNLEKIEKCFRSNKFNELKDAIQLDSSTYNIKIMKLFKKDFYLQF